MTGAQDGAARVADELRRASERLSAAGIDTARRDAEWLMVHSLGVDLGRLALVDTIEDGKLSVFRAAVARRSERIPLQHIVGTVAFGPLDLAVGPGVFTPRPETEYLFEWARTQAISSDAPVRVADLCSGSGALALALATTIPQAEVIAVEADEEALTWLRRNVADAPAAVRRRIEVVAADVTDPARMSQVLPAATLSVIVSNPPYVPIGSEVGPEVAHDPQGAVFAGADGMDVIRPMVPIIAAALAPGGVVGIEHDDTTADAVSGVLSAHGGFDEVVSRRDLAGRRRFVTARRLGAHGVGG